MCGEEICLESCAKVIQVSENKLCVFWLQILEKLARLLHCFSSCVPWWDVVKDVCPDDVGFQHMSVLSPKQRWSWCINKLGAGFCRPEMRILLLFHHNSAPEIRVIIIMPLMLFWSPFVCWSVDWKMENIAHQGVAYTGSIDVDFTFLPRFCHPVCVTQRCCHALVQLCRLLM